MIFYYCNTLFYGSWWNQGFQESYSDYQGLGLRVVLRVCKFGDDQLKEQSFESQPILGHIWHSNCNAIVKPCDRIQIMGSAQEESMSRSLPNPWKQTGARISFSDFQGSKPQCSFLLYQVYYVFVFSKTFPSICGFSLNFIKTIS